MTNGTQNVTLVTNTYDNQTLTNITSLREHDADYGTSFVYRGNISVIAPVGGPSQTTQRDITGTATSIADGLGHTVAVTSSSTNNYAVPAAITPNANTTLQTSATYTQWLAPSSVTQPNNATSSTTYDTFGRPQQSTSVYGAVTSYTYSTNGALPMVVTVTTNSHWTKTTLDGFGRTVQFDRGYNNGPTPVTVSTVNTVYDSCGCSPLGKVKQVSRPYAPGGTQYWTIYSYDGLGRTASIVLPDGASTTTYSYSGNTATITDPAGKWKQNVSDAFGNLKTVNEPNPAGGASLATNYTYDVMNHLTQVSMPRGSTTQTRTFAYDTNQRLSSAANPENSAVSYTYKTDGTVDTRTDAIGQVTKYTYDSYQRVIMIQRFPTAGSEDLCQRMSLTYDNNTANVYFTQNGSGRLVTAQYGGTSCTSMPGVVDLEMYSYTPAGQMTKKFRQDTIISGGQNYQYEADYTYDNEGNVTSLKAPLQPNYWAGSTDIPPVYRTYTYSFDAMDRPISMKDDQSPKVTWVQGVQYGPSDEITQLTRVASFDGTNYTFSTETRQYNSLLQLTRLTVPGGEDIEYAYSGTQNNGRITQTIEHVTNETVGYSYDALNRLIAANASASNLGPAWGLSFAYDGFGNLTDKTVTAGSAPPLHILVDPATNRISTTGYSYDANGNLTASPNSFSATFDVENRLGTITTSAGVVKKFAYDLSGKQAVGKTTSTSPQNWAMTFYGAYGERLITYYQLSNPHAAWSVYFGSQRIWDVDSTAYANGLSTAGDRLGTVRAFGTQTRGYYPYGEQYGASMVHDTFATYWVDADTGLSYALQRYYSSTLGRFLTVDPDRGSANFADPQSWNRYAYGCGDPVNTTDPSGLDPQSETCDKENPPATCLLPTRDSSTVNYSTADTSGTTYTYVPGHDEAPVVTAIGPGGDDPQTDPGYAASHAAPTGVGFNAYSVTVTGSLTEAGAAIGGFVGGAPGMLVGALVGSMAGAGVNVSYVSSSHNVYVGVALTFTPLVPGSGQGITGTGYLFPNGQDPDKTMSGLSTSVGYQPSPITGSTVTQSPGQSSVVGVSVGTEAPVTFGIGYNWCWTWWCH